MKNVKALLLFVFLMFIGINNVKAQECKYSITGNSLTDYNVNGTPATYSYDIVCITNSSNKTVSCNVNNCKWSNNASNSKCTFDSVKTDLDYNDFAQGGYECADSIYSVVTTSQVGSHYNGGYTKVDLSYIVSSSTKGKYSGVTFKTSILTNKEDLKNNNINSSQNQPGVGGSNGSEGAGTKNDLDLEHFCKGPVQGIFTTLGWVFFIVKILVPILLIIFGSIDFAKAILSSKDDEIKKSAKTLAMRAVIGILIFFIPTILNLVINVIDSSKNDNNASNVYKGTFWDCTRCMLDPNDNTCSKLGGKN